MRSNIVSHVRDAITLPFLFETRTILRLPPSTQVRSLSSSQYAQVTDEKKPPTQTKKSSFLKEKAATSKSKSKSNKIGTTITSAERKVFDDIFNQVAGKTPEKAGSPPRDKVDTFIDHEEILAIFSSAVASHAAEKKALAQREAAQATAAQQRRTLEDEEQALQRYPKPLRKAARRAAAAAIAAEDIGTLEGPASNVARNVAGEPQIRGEPTPTNSGQADLAGAEPAGAELAGAELAEAELVEAELVEAELVEAEAQHTDRKSGQKSLDREVEPSTSEGDANGRGPPSVFRPSLLIADNKDEDGQQTAPPPSLRNIEKIEEGESRSDLRIKPPGLRPSFLTVQQQGNYFRKGLRPSFLTTEKRAEDVASFAEHYGAVRPSFIRRDADAAVVQEKLQHDAESVFQGTIHRYCREEMDRLAKSFQDAVQRHGDVGIWNTCLAKVFPMVDLLDTSLRKEKSLRDVQVQEHIQKAPSEISNSDTPNQSAILPRAESPLPDLPPYVPPLYIISRLYPAAILLAFRLLRTKFPTSPLALALLPQIRSSGPTSYVLGASTEFYNALIELRWDIYSDLRGVDGLLMEMERSGVGFDMGTWNTLVKIGGERFADLHDADGGARGAGFWERPHNVRWFQKVAVEWKMVVASRLREQGLGAEISEREYGPVSLADKAPADAEQGTVWL